MDKNKKKAPFLMELNKLIYFFNLFILFNSISQLPQ